MKTLNFKVFKLITYSFSCYKLCNWAQKLWILKESKNKIKLKTMEINQQQLKWKKNFKMTKTLTKTNEFYFKKCL